MNYNQAGNTSQNSNSQKLSSFLETLKKRQQIKGPASPDNFLPTSFVEIKKRKELESQRIEQFHQARSKEWSQVYSAKQKQIEKRIEEIQQQLKQLAKQIIKFDTNINQAVQEIAPEPGMYHISFLDHLKNVIELLQKNVAEANSWLSVYQSRAKKVGHYWKMSQKKGQSFTLNEERQLATSIG